ncbi:MAG: hybrid sensor histidine kinase/response regulator [Alphaproteobacteria bacterium]|nr:hybrid sensor histidine kinase/response regulator [Alphaproteobacteria bacterium]
MNVLLVEDDPNHAELVVLAFGDELPSATVTVAGDIATGLRTAPSLQPDVIVCDAHLPDGTCLDLLRGLPGRRAPIVVLTAHGDHDTAVAAMKAGAADYLTKSPALFEALPKLTSALVQQDVALVRLEATEDRLRHADRLIGAGQLAAVTAHEVGTPLNVVRIGLQEIARKSGDDELQGLARDLIAHVDTVARRLRGMLDYSRAPSGRRRTLSLLGVVTQAVTLLEPLSRKLGATVTVEGPDALVDGDAEQLQQVLFNLVTNALQAEAKQVRIRLVPTGDRVGLEVADDGPGVPVELGSRVFEPFVTTKPAGGGTGLGLAVCADIVRDHGGSIVLVAGPGACFRVDLPTV